MSGDRRLSKSVCVFLVHVLYLCMLLSVVAHNHLRSMIVSCSSLSYLKDLSISLLALVSSSSNLLLKTDTNNDKHKH